MTILPSITAATRRLPGIDAGGSGVWLVNASLLAGALALWTSVVKTQAVPPLAGSVPVPWWALVPVFLLAEAYVVHVHFRPEAHTISLNEVALVGGLYALRPEALLLAQLLGSGLALVVYRRQRPVKFVFNLAQFSLTTALAVLIFQRLSSLGDPFGLAGWSGAVVAATTASLLGIFFVTVAIGVAQREWMGRQLVSAARFSLAATATTSCIALLGVELVRIDARAALLLALPVVVFVLAFRAFARQLQRHEHLEFLYESMKRTQGTAGLSAALGQLLAAVQHLVQARYAEILLLPRGGDPGLRSTSDADGGMVSRAELPGSEDERLLALLRSDEVLLLPARRPSGPLDAYLAHRGLPDAMVAALRGDDGPFGLLVVGDRAGDVESFTDDSARLLETFAGHASVLLENGRLEQTLADVTELKERLRHQAFHDTLTGLPNRALFAEQIAAALADRRGEGDAAVLFIDLDDFKSVNDSRGHSVGDELLVQVATRVRRCVRPGDLPARLGGDEFGLLLAATTPEGAEAAARRLVEALSDPFVLGSRETYVHASVGIALAEDARDSEELLRNADIAMYAAKAAGKKRFAHYEASMHQRVRTLHDLALDLEHAADRDEIAVVFQPIVSLRDGRVAAFEALARWIHPDRGVVPPNAFIPIAEEAGLMESIGASVLRQACSAVREWQRFSPEGAPIGVTVNHSPSQLRGAHLVDDVQRTLHETRLEGSSLVLEVTESATMHDIEFVVDRLRDLRALDVGLALDDFGTGHSSLERLDALPLDLVKVAKPFLDRLLQPGSNTSFVDAFVRLARSLGIACVAEGIEHPLQVSKLVEVGCDLGQGFYYARPMPGSAVGEFLRTRSRGPRAESRGAVDAAA